MDPFLSLHKYFIWSTWIQRPFKDAIARVSAGSKLEPEHLMADDIGAYMSYWYGALYVVVEGYRKLGFSDPAVDALLQSPNVELLRRYRNGVFHFQKNYFDERFIDLVSEAGTPLWTRQLSAALGTFFLRELDARKKVST